MPPLLNQTLDATFHPDDNITDILRRGMIDGKYSNWSYDLFFEKCGANYCSYSVSDRQNIIIIITSVIGIASGLSVALQLLTPLLFHIAHWCLGNLQSNACLTHQVDFNSYDIFFIDGRLLLTKIQQIPLKVIHLNLFFNASQSTEATARYEKSTTRLYLLIWVIVFLVLVIHNILAEQTITINVSEPDEFTYSQLYTFYNTSLQCLCSTIGFRYVSFVKLEARLHQICYSSFIEDLWIENMYYNRNWSKIAINEFRGNGVVYFLGLKSVCNTAQRMIDVIILDVEQSRMWQRTVYSKVQLFSQIGINTENLKKRSLNDFQIFRRAAQSATEFNQLMNIFSNNWAFTPIDAGNMNISNYRLITQPVSHGSNCSCATSSSCTEPVLIDGEFISDLKLGCSPMESLLRSSLICLYNATCVEQINFNNVSWIHPLNSTVTSRFSVNSLVNEITDEAMIEEWVLNISYSSYFSACQPSSCTYSVSMQKTVLEMIAMFLGLYGGLTIILRFIAQWIIHGTERLIIRVNYRRNRIISLM